MIVLQAGVEPARPQWPRDFKSLMSTNSIIGGSVQYFKELLSRMRIPRSRPADYKSAALPLS